MLATWARLVGYTLLAPASFLHCSTLKTSHDFTGTNDFNNPAELNFRDTLDVTIVNEFHLSRFVDSSFHFHSLGWVDVVVELLASPETGEGEAST